MFLLGIDLGTSSVKCAVVDAATLRVVGSPAGEEYPTVGGEQNPEDWWAATINVVRQAVADAGVDPDAIRGIGFSGQMHGGVLMDAAGNAVTPAITWKDTRSVEQVQFLTALDVPEAPGPPATGFMAATLMWLLKNTPDVLEKAHRLLMPKDYLRFRLTGEMSTDASDAAATWLLDVRTGQWSDALIHTCGLESVRHLLPPIHPSIAVTGTLTSSAAAVLNLPAGIPVVTGAADQPAQALGHGIVGPESALVTVGTGGQVHRPMDAPNLDAKGRYYAQNHAAPGRWYALAAILSAGDSLKWLRSALEMTEQPGAYARLSTVAATIPLGSGGLVFLPYLVGERAPHNDSQASGMFLGLRHHHGLGHMARSVMEGVAFAMLDCFNLVADMAPVQRLVLSGGITQSALWPGIMTDVFGQPFEILEDTTHSAVAACVGGAMMAAVGVDLYESLDAACAQLALETRTLTPDPDHHARYGELYAVYRELYPRLKDLMHSLSAV